jgi:arylsulfatase A-like enzyme
MPSREGRHSNLRPNIILVITDDQGYGDLACNGNPYIKTPSLDQFSREAVSFTNYHVSTTCAPTRGALMTGRYTNRLNVYHTISGRSLLYEEEVTLPEILASNGYRCGMFGKWHLGDNYPFRPEDRGFHEVVRHGGGGITQMPDFWGNDYFDDTYWHNGELQAYEGYCTDVFFEEAVRFIKENRDRPFFCYLSTNAPHGPLNVPAEYIQMYNEADLVPERMKRFYGMITNIDDNFHRLEQELDELGIKSNTLLIFMTDNGTALGHTLYNAGMKGHKGSEYEGGHRVPMMCRWPGGHIGGGLKLNQLTAHIDLLPTLIDLLDLEFEPYKPLDGISLVPLLSGQPEHFPERILFVDTQRGLDLVKYKSYSVMEEDWRMVNGRELYHLTEDPGQEHNLIDMYPETATELKEAYEGWWQSVLNEGVEDRFAYIQAGSPKENPVRICSHDMRSPSMGFWHQYGAVEAAEGSGIWKVEIVEEGDYSVSLRRFPRESGWGINAQFPARPGSPELERAMPACRQVGFTEASFRMADFRQVADIEEDEEEVAFTLHLLPGRYDMEAVLKDREGRTYPSYFVYIEKLN